MKTVRSSHKNGPQRPTGCGYHGSCLSSERHGEVNDRQQLAHSDVASDDRDRTTLIADIFLNVVHSPQNAPNAESADRSQELPELLFAPSDLLQDFLK